MSTKSKLGQYVAAGVQASPGMRLNVRSNVRLPDSEAGCSWAEEEAPKPFYAETVRPARRQPVTVSLRTASVLLCALFVVFGVLTLNKAVQRADLSKRITALESAIAETEKDNAELLVQVAQARDTARIGYAALQLEMVYAAGVEAVPVQAPDTRPFETEPAPGDAVNAAPEALIAGSL